MVNYGNAKAMPLTEAAAILAEPNPSPAVAAKQVNLVHQINIQRRLQQ